MRITSRASVEYVPTWNGNRDLPEEEQVKVTVVFPTAADREDLQPIAVREGEDIVVKSSWAKAVKKHISKVRGLVDVVDGVEVELKNGLDLTTSKSSELDDLIKELGLVILRNFGLSDDEKKSSKSDSESTEKKG